MEQISEPVVESQSATDRELVSRAKIRGPLHIGSDVMMGPDVIILTSTHEISRTDIPMREQGGVQEKKIEQ